MSSTVKGIIWVALFVGVIVVMIVNEDLPRGLDVALMIGSIAAFVVFTFWAAQGKKKPLQ